MCLHYIQLIFNDYKAIIKGETCFNLPSYNQAFIILYDNLLSSIDIIHIYSIMEVFLSAIILIALCILLIVKFFCRAKNGKLE